MVLRRPNLLDAFRQMAPAPGASVSPPSEKPVVQPSASPAPSARAPAPPPAARTVAPHSSPHVMPVGFERMLGIGLLVVIVVLGLFLYLRGHGPTSQAAAAETPPSAGTSTPAVPAAPPAASAAPVNRTTQDADFLDKKNRYTLRLIQYDNDENGRARAAETYRWLVKFGIPVVQPIRMGGDKHLVLCASARAGKDDLVPLRDHVRELKYPEGAKTRPFSDAYIDEIDHIVAR